MPRRKSPLRTPALLAACRANARKSHGPKTIKGKARASLNLLKHGRYALHLRRKLLEAGAARAKGFTLGLGAGGHAVLLVGLRGVDSRLRGNDG
jgi:hypothetical protein